MQQIFGGTGEEIVLLWNQGNYYTVWGLTLAGSQGLTKATLSLTSATGQREKKTVMEGSLVEIKTGKYHSTNIGKTD